MNQRKHVVFTLVIVILAVIAMSVNTVLAGGFDKTTPPAEPAEHPPVCHRVETLMPGWVGLECNDVGKDIINVEVKANTKYELRWNAENVILRVYTGKVEPTASYAIFDKNGSVVIGNLP